MKADDRVDESWLLVIHKQADVISSDPEHASDIAQGKRLIDGRSLEDRDTHGRTIAGLSLARMGMPPGTPSTAARVRCRRMRRLSIPFAAIAAVLIVSSPLLWGGGVDLPDDASYYGLASWEWLARAVRDGVSPWWVSGKLGGVSLFSDVVPQGPFYPFAWLGLVLPVIPAMGLSALLHAVGTLFAVRWLARIHGVRRELAWLAGAGVAAGPLAVWAAIDFQVDAWPTFLWFPIVLSCLENSAQARASQDRTAWTRWIALGAMATSLMLLGSHLRLGSAAGAALALWSLLRGKDLGGAALMGTLGLVGGAPAYLPMLLEARVQSMGSGLPALGTSPDLALGFWNIAGWLTPKVMLFDRDLGVGALLGVGVIVAVTSLLRAEPQWRRTALFAGLLMLAGTRVPGARQLLAPLTLLTHPVNLVYPALAVIVLAVLGAGGLDWLLQRRRVRSSERRIIGAVVLGLLGLASLRLALGGNAFASAYAHTLYVLAVLQGVVILGLGALWIRRGEAPVQGLVLLALADLALFGIRSHLAVPSAPLRATGAVQGDVSLLYEGYLDVEDLARGFEAPRADMDDEDNRALRRAERSQAHEEEVVAYEVEAPLVQARLLERPWPVHAGMALHVQGIAGRSKVLPARTAALLEPLADDLADLTGAGGADTDVLTHLFAPGGRGWRVLEIFGARTAVWGTQVLARRPSSNGPCRLISANTVEENQGRRINALLDRGGASHPALLEAPLPEGPAPGPAQMLCSTSGTSIIQDVSVPSGRRALVAVRRPLHPGWHVVDEPTGAELKPFPVDQVHQGVLLDAGEHRLRWQFAPPGLRTSLVAAGIAWFFMLAVLARAHRGRLIPVMLLLLATPLSAGATEGTLLGAEPGVSYEVLLTSSLDLTQDKHILGRAPLSPEAPDFVLPTHPGPNWVFLRQEISRPSSPPLVFHRPADLLPLSDADSVVLHAVPRDLALLRDRRDAAPGWWRVPTVLAFLVLVGLPLLRRRLMRGTPGSHVREEHAVVVPHEVAAAPPRREWALLGAILGTAVLLRLPGMGASLDLLEWSYGPGSSRIVPLGEEPSLAQWLMEALLDPPCLELVHPPLWHWLSNGIHSITGGLEWAMRLPSLLLSVSTAALIWWLMRGVSPRVGLAAAAAFAIAPPAVHFGRDATPYALLGFVCVSSLILLLRALRLGSVASWAAWAGILVAGFLTHYATVFFGLAQVAALLVLGVRTPGAGRLAAAQACKAGIWVLPLPVAWTALHFSHFGATALDTRLYADTYPLDPGALRFFGEFGSVALGMPPSLGTAALVLAFLAGFGLLRIARELPALGVLLAATTVGFVIGCGFFYWNLITELGGHVFWGFRWVSWFLPAALCMAAASLNRAWSWAMAAVWVAGALYAPSMSSGISTRPDYRGAAALIAEDIQERDGLAALPLWGQRGPVRTYLVDLMGGTFTDTDGTAVWNLDGKNTFLEMHDERLPFESSARNAHVDRLWVVVPDERMFGREKFRSAVAAQALEWANKTMTLVRTVELDHLTLALYDRGPIEFPPSINPLSTGAVPYLEPNAPPCAHGVDEWQFVLRATTAERVSRVANGTVRALVTEPSNRSSSLLVRGGDCTGPPPEIAFEPPNMMPGVTGIP